jgi:hypothetical protein
MKSYFDVMRRFSIGFVCLVGFAACACSSDSDAPADAPPAAVAENVVTFESTDFELAPGDEKYMCWARNLPADKRVVVSEITGEYGPGTHHVFFGWTLAPETEEMFECPVLFKTTWIPIYLGGVDSSPLTLPDGAGVDLETGKQLVLQLHLQNTLAKPIVNRVKMKMKLRDPEEPFDAAGVFGLDNRVIALPPNSTDVRTSMSCKPGRTMNVFSVLGHMHKLGQKLEVSHNGNVVFTQPWNFDEQPITPFQLQVAPEDELGISCLHSNPGSNMVTYGESSDTEMCATVFYHTPYEGLSGCVNTAPP